MKQWLLPMPLQNMRLQRSSGFGSTPFGWACVALARWQSSSEAARRTQTTPYRRTAVPLLSSATRLAVHSVHSHTIEVRPEAGVRSGMDPPGVVYAGRGNARPTRARSRPLSRILLLAIVLVGTSGSVALHFRAVLSALSVVADSTQRSRKGDDLPRAEERRAEIRAVNEMAPAEAGDGPSNKGQAQNDSTVVDGVVVATGNQKLLQLAEAKNLTRLSQVASMTSDRKAAEPRVDKSEVSANDAVDLSVSRAVSKSRKASINGTKPAYAIITRGRSNITIPAAMAGLADLDSRDYPSATPVYWRVPKAGGTTAQVVLARCLGLVVASESGPVIEASQRRDNVTAGGGGPRVPPERLRVVQEGRQRFVNVDVTTKRGILEAKGLDPMGSGLVDVALAPELLPFVAHLLDGSRGVRGRAFALFRHPVERFASMFYYLQTVSGIHLQRRRQVSFRN